MLNNSEYLNIKKQYLVDNIQYQIRKRENIKYKIELTKQKHERISKEIQVLKKEISELSSNINEKKFETLKNTKSKNNVGLKTPEKVTLSQNLENGKSNHKIKEETTTDDVVIKSERQLLFDVKSKKKLKSTVIKLFKKIIRHKINIKKCRRLNRMNCQIKLNSHLNPNEKVILVEDNGNKVKVKLVGSSQDVLPAKKSRQYYHIDYDLADVQQEYFIDKDDNGNESKSNDTENKDCSMIILNPITCSDITSEENKFFISRLGNKLIEEYFYLISAEPFQICPIYGDVVINRDIYESIKPVIINSLKNKQRNTVPFINIVHEKDLDDIQKEMELGLQNIIGINHKNNNKQTPVNDKDLDDIQKEMELGLQNIIGINHKNNNNQTPVNDKEMNEPDNNSDVIDLTNFNNDSESLDLMITKPTDPLDISKEEKLKRDNPILKSLLTGDYCETSGNENFVRTQISTCKTLPKVKVREYVQMDSVIDRSKTQNIETVIYNSISLDSDDDMEEIS